jgi:hypothetical protein
VGKITQLLEEERTQNAKLLRKYTRLKMKYVALQRVRARLDQELTEGRLRRSIL